ncbi:uncharacterized protein LAESUDRAFT_154285 [Laetiporus sulphureus 93-53]|uniref:F-box domain-containing protein n=1 Tax=Laetiporus sulphureus 93-53 TaxID=1314785 RepID=A0A165HK52_9APHY|nr:uncharacterized protein LAESUDRAFT_154285 [Laetiporus sulphureus 93-53]KZT11834.1 hypothetical protein LAESUDRAFT_154285 [Laetiporus sulphureus 93-53]
MPAELPRLFPELCDVIIDCLHDDPRALIACSQVCREWVHTSRAILFHKVCLPGRQVRSLVSLLRSEHQTISGAVKELSISILDEHAVLTEILAEILASLHAIKTLKLLHFVLSTGVSQVFAIMPAKVKKLKLGMIIGLDLHLVELLSSFPALDTLSFPQTLESPIIYGARQPITHFFPRPPLRALELCLPFPSAEKILDALISLSILESFEDLSLHCPEALKGKDGVKYMSAVARLLSGLGPQLERLELDLRSNSYPFLQAQHIDLRHCTRLRDISIKSATERTSQAWAPLVLRNLNTASIRTVRFILRPIIRDRRLRPLAAVIEAPYTVSTPWLDWMSDWINREAFPLSSAKCPLLERVTFEVFLRPSLISLLSENLSFIGRLDDLEAHLQSQYAYLNIQDLLSVEVTPLNNDRKKEAILAPSP